MTNHAAKLHSDRSSGFLVIARHSILHTKLQKAPPTVQTNYWIKLKKVYST